MQVTFASTNRALITDIGVTIPNFVQNFEELTTYLKELKGSPNALKPDILAWKDYINTKNDSTIKNFLNGEEVVIMNNKLTIIVSNKLVSSEDDARRMVDYVFDNDSIEIGSTINNMLGVSAVIDKSSYRIISQIREPQFFKKKDPVKIRVTFKTKLKLSQPIGDIPDRDYENGITFEDNKDKKFFKVLKRLLNQPESLYISVPEVSGISHGKYFNTNPTIFNTPQSMEDVQKLFYYECFFMQDVGLNGLCELASKFGSSKIVSQLETLEDKFIPFNAVFGNDQDQGCSLIQVQFPNKFESFDKIYDKLQVLIEVLQTANEYASHIQAVTTYEFKKEFKKDDVKVSFITNKSTPFHTLNWKYNYWNPRVPNNAPNDIQKNFDDLKKGLSKLLKNCMLLAQFLSKDVFEFYKDRPEPIQRRELGDFVFSRIALDPLFYADCGTKGYEKFSRMILNC